MNVKDKVVVITGGGGGIGSAMAQRFAAEGAKVVVSDLDGDAAVKVAEGFGGLGLMCDVTSQESIAQMVAKTEEYYGDIDLFCNNAGVAFGDGEHAVAAPDKAWEINWQVNVMSHVYAARVLLPKWLERGHGYFLQTVSAAGLLAQPGDAAYTATKHAALGFAESLAIAHGEAGIKVSAICPQYVATKMVGIKNGEDYSNLPGVITPEKAMDSVIAGLETEQFLILTHPEVETFWKNKLENYDRWLGGMRKVQRKQYGDQHPGIFLSEMSKAMRS
jgi:NAD(P)-dependent dehydrogenase (short-subunit alcohol dehydrogenase family)